MFLNAMSRLHFLNVKNGDCSIIEHNSGHVTMIDICNARSVKNSRSLSTNEHRAFLLDSVAMASASGSAKNYCQKLDPVNPISYLGEHGIANIFRLAITHPDMDHMDGLKDLFEFTTPENYYDTKNKKAMEDGWDGSPYREEDWKLYKYLRDNPTTSNPKCIRIYSGDNAAYRTMDWNGKAPGDAFYTLSPTPDLVDASIESGDYNDASYVFLWKSCAGTVLFAGDSHDKTWEHLLKNHPSDVSDIDLLIAPHHGRKSGRSFDFLNTVKPKMTFFGNAPSKDLSYDAWRNRNLPFITNNMAGSMVVNCGESMDIFVTNRTFAEDRNPKTFYSEHHYAWFLQSL